MMAETPGTNRPVWDAEATHAAEAGKVREALNQVMDPEIGLSIIQLGLIRNLKLTEGQALLRMILTTPFCPYGPALIDLTRVKAEEALNMPVSIELGMEVWDFSMMEEGVDMDWGLY